MLPEYLVIDSSCVMMAVYYVQRKFVSEDQLTAEYLADNTIRAIQNLQARLIGISNVKVVLVHDIGRSFRYRLFPEYKAGRPDHEHYKSIKMDCIQIIGEKSNIINFGLEGLEADDLAYLISTQISDCWFVSNDNDWKTILCHSAQRFYKYTNQVGWFQINSPDRKELVEPIMEKILLGCKSDKIPSVIKPNQFKKITWQEVPEPIANEILSAESINYYWFFSQCLKQIQLDNEDLVDDLYDLADRNWSLTFYSWGNYLDYVNHITLRMFKKEFARLLGVDFIEDEA